MAPVGRHATFPSQSAFRLLNFIHVGLISDTVSVPRDGYKSGVHSTTITVVECVVSYALPIKYGMKAEQLYHG